MLTDAPYFQGDPAHLRAARAATTLPVLRKDFMLDPWQIYESRAMGADCVLLIMAALTNATGARDSRHIARQLDMDVLVGGARPQGTGPRALGLQTPLIGVNNRNLQARCKPILRSRQWNLLPSFPPDRLLITESGIRDRDDVHRLGEAGAQCLLVGESLLRQPDVGAAIHALLGTCSET